MLDFIINFAYGWYIRGSKKFWNGAFGFIKSMDSDLGVIANIYNWTSPLYGDYSYGGRIIGPIFRTGRIFLGSAVCMVVFLTALAVYVIWLALPAVVLIMFFSNLLTFV